MKPGRAFLRLLACLTILAAVAALDWYPSVKALGRLGRQQGDLAAKTKNYMAMASGFAFPAGDERLLFARGNARLRRALPAVTDDHAWTAIVLMDLQERAREDRIPHARVLLEPRAAATELGTAAPGAMDPLSNWIGRESAAIQDGFARALGPGCLPWQELLLGSGSRRGRPATRPLCLAAMAPLPELLHFINHVSWGEARLEIVRLRLQPGPAGSRAWLVCRGNYLVHARSGWEVPKVPGSGDSLLVDPDSPLLLQKVDPLLAPGSGKRELPPFGSPW
jgi:hypothetical protein